AEAFKRLDADGGAALSDRRSTRLTSEHLAQELGGGLSGADLVARAGVLAIANDLVPATAALLPELRMLRRGLARLLARPVGQSGSGPTLWALYPSPRAAEEAAATVWTAVDDARLVTPGNAGLTIHATTIAGPGSASTPGRNP
ncbi:MAG TPA: hypothetical protein VFI34_12570, partial [Candidatus Limnocylindrales bacterium]|nr:hypothetical protein [Candidatus Limnocylindrales bacterium]